MHTIWTTGDAEEALDHAGTFLRAEPVLHTVLLTLLATRSTPGTHLGVDDDAGNTVGFARFDPGRDIVCATALGGEAIAAMVPVLAPLSTTTQINGPVATTASLVGAWTEFAGIGATPHQGQRLYECIEPPAAPPTAPGTFRLATHADIDVLMEYNFGFDRDHREPRTREQVEGYIEVRLGGENLFAWEHDGTIVSICGASEPVEGVTRIQGVYTPPALRNRGFAAACVGAASQILQERGLRRALFTDLANPTSNGIYRRLGYRAVSEEIAYKLVP